MNTISEKFMEYFINVRIVMSIGVTCFYIYWWFQCLVELQWTLE